jgi:hypothetical protein
MFHNAFIKRIQIKAFSLVANLLYTSFNYFKVSMLKQNLVFI